MAENFSENDDDYVSSSVVQAVKVKSGADGFLIRMPDGRQLRCVHDGPQAGYTAIILKVEDGSDLLLPIIVLEPPLLVAEVRDVPNARSTQCQLMKVMTEEMGYSGKLVRITKRAHEAYCAQVYLAKVGDETKGICFDLPPSDAIDIAVRCKVPIQVNKHLAFSDGIGGVEPNHKKGVNKEREQQLKVVADQTPEPEPEPEPFKLSFSSVFEIAFQVMAVLGFVSFFYPN